MFALEMYEWIFISIMIIQETKNFPFAFFFLFTMKMHVCESECLCGYGSVRGCIIQLNSSFQQRILAKLSPVIVNMRQFYVFSSLLFRNEEIVFAVHAQQSS